MRLVQERDLGWTPVPVPMTDGEASERAADYRGIEPEQLEVELPAYVGQLEGTSRVARNGDMWLQRRTWEGARPNPFHEERVMVPYDPDQPVRDLVLPENFRLQSVLGDLLLGVHIDEATDEQTVRVYRVRW